MAVYQLRTFADIVSAIREELGVQSNDTTAINRIKRDVNIVYNEILDKRWWWLSGNTTVQLPAYVSSGSVTVTANSQTVTLSVAPTSSKKGYYFAVDGYNEIYKIESHSANSTTIQLSDLYTGPSSNAASYRIWTDKIPLPTDCKETIEVWHDHSRSGLDNVGLQEFRRISGMAPRAEGKPAFYTTADFKDPQQNASISSLPSLSTRTSTGIIKTLVFSNSIPTSIVTKVSNGDPVRWNISNAGHPSYNGDIFVSAISTTSVSNDTVTYIGRGEYTESATADTSLTVTSITSEFDYDRYRELMVYPSLSSARVTLHVDYVKEAHALENDSDEPLMPLEDRTVLLYGGLARAWRRLRNPEEANTNLGLYTNKLTKMEGKLQDSFDSPKLRPSKIYLGAKRASSRGRVGGPVLGVVGGGGAGSSSVVSGTPDTVAVFSSHGEIQGSAAVSSTELTFLDDVVPLTEVSLADNQSSSATILSYTKTYKKAAIEYLIYRGSTLEGGRIDIVTDGTSVGLAVSGASLSSTGVTITASISGSNVLLQYTSTSTGTAPTFRYKLQKF
jgi:hypothetical protein